MKNALQVYATIKALADYLADDAEQFFGPNPTWETEDRRRELKSVRDELDQLASDARTGVVTHFQFQKILEKLEMLDAVPPGDLISKITYNLYDR